MFVRPTSLDENTARHQWPGGHPGRSVGDAGGIGWGTGATRPRSSSSIDHPASASFDFAIRTTGQAYRVRSRHRIGKQVVQPALLAAVRQWARDCDIVHVHGSWRYHLQAAAKVSRECDLPYIIRPAGNLGVISSGHKWYVKRPYFFLFERRNFERAAAIHCTSQEESRQMASLRLRTRKFVVPNAVAVERSATVSGDALATLCPELKPHQKVVLYLGRITWIKRLDALLEGFIQVQQNFPDWCLILAGTLEDHRIVQRLREQAEKHGIASRVMLPGTVMGEAKAALFSRADIFAQPSLHENFGASVAEALCYGIPCVVSNGVALAPDVAEEGAGLVCESAPGPLADSLRQLMRDPELRSQCGRKALELARRYQPENVADSVRS